MIEATPKLSLDLVGVYADNLDHPECVAVGPDGSVFAGGEAGQIYRLTGGEEAKTIARTSGIVLGLAVDQRGEVIACDATSRSVLRVRSDGRTSVLSEGAPTRRFVVPNYPCFGPAGLIFVTDSGDFGERNGALLVIARDGATAVASDELSGFPNGLAFDERNQRLLIVMSDPPELKSASLDSQGAILEIETLARLEGYVPDGVAVDADGGIWIGCYCPDAVLRWTPSGGTELMLHDPRRTTLSSPTNLAFFGAASNRLLIANYGLRHVSVVDVGVAGAQRCCSDDPENRP